MISTKKQQRIELIKLTIKLISKDGLTVTEACNVTSVSRGTIYRYMPNELKQKVTKYTSNKIIDSIVLPEISKDGDIKLDT